MGGKSKSITTGYKYYVGRHDVICHGPIDALLRIEVDERHVWTGVCTGGELTIAADDIFGGDSREGGISGSVDVDMGAADQGKNAYLVGQLGNDIPGYRGVVSIIAKDCYHGNNPYLKAWKYRAQRIHVTDDGEEQWYDEKAAIPSNSSEWPAGTAVKLSWQQGNSGSKNFTGKVAVIFYNEGGTEVGRLDSPLISVPKWTERTVEGPIPNGAAKLKVFVEFKRGGINKDNPIIDDIKLEIDGAPISIINGNAENGTTGWKLLRGKIGTGSSAGAFEGSFYFLPGIWPNPVMEQFVTLPQTLDMNPAHIIRECLTNPEWGMGYSDADIDEASFVAAADKLFDEGLGMSLLWDKEILIEEFVSEITRHIDAALYVSRQTGKFVLKLIRADYELDDLITLDDSNIEKVSDPKRSAYNELISAVTVVHWSQLTGKDASVTVQDTALTQAQSGSPSGTTIQYPGFTNSRNGTIAAQRDLKVLSSPFLACTIYANSVAKNLNPGDVFIFNWPSWGVFNAVMRISGIAYGNGRNSQVRISCTEDIYSTPTVALINPNTGEWINPNKRPIAIPAADQAVFEAPYYELIQAVGQSEINALLAEDADLGYVMAAASRPEAAISARVWVDAGAGYADNGSLDFGPSAILSANVGKVATLLSVAEMDEINNVTIGQFFQLGNEILRVDEIDLGAGEMTVGRGVLDTVPQPHVAAERLIFWDEYSGFDPTEYTKGETLSVRLTPITGMGQLSVGSATPMPLTMQGRAWAPYPPGDLRVNDDSYEDNVYSGELEITWKHRDRQQQTSGELLDHTDASVGPEVGTVYRLQGYLDGVLVHTEDDIDGEIALWEPSATGFVKIEVHSKRDDVYSLQAPWHEFIWLGEDEPIDAEGRVTEPGDLRLTEDGAIRFTEN